MAMTLAGVLEAAEAAAPMESLDVVARMLKEHLGAASASLLITDFTGSSVVRLGAADTVETGEPARRIPLRDTLYDDVIRRSAAGELPSRAHTRRQVQTVHWQAGSPRHSTSSKNFYPNEDRFSYS
ncbi:hypothetical protein [Streptomyces sp. NBC_01565]|uniref:hypothetical protein n=1 Tax=unclassified Streptomyces TaxID=2593676 RepID=UPI00225115B3|nr:hypothetical protein [Streptomyces sp. NBC_01565]MCX4546777.1 hypothetical protein [Streptomyces sp. NBC_01565]